MDGKRPMPYDKQHVASTWPVVGGLAAEQTGESAIHGDSGGGDAGRAREGAAELSGAAGRLGPEYPRLVCVVDADRAEVLLPPLREHFADEPLVAVVVERRTPNRIRRLLEPVEQAHRRAPIAERDPVRALPPALRHEARHLRLVQRMEPLRRTHEDTDMADLVGKCLAVEPEAVFSCGGASRSACWPDSGCFSGGSPPRTPPATYSAGSSTSTRLPGRTGATNRVA